MSAAVPSQKTRISGTGGNDIWEGDLTNISGVALKGKIPEVPRIPQAIQIYSGGFAEMVYMAIVLSKTRDKHVFIKALASGIIMANNTPQNNITGSATPVTALTGLNDASDTERYADALVVKTNFDDAPNVTYGELRALADMDDDELGFYFGLLVYAGVKPRTDANRQAYNDRRQNAVRAQCSVPPVIFVANSPFLADSVLDLAKAAFISLLPVRINIMASVVNGMSDTPMGAQLAFQTFLLLCRENGMAALVIIKQAAMKYEWVRSAFPEVRTELAAANAGQKLVRAAPESIRPFVKAVYGNSLVPVSYADINNLLGICKNIMERSVTTYGNYNGGQISQEQEAKVNTLMLLEAPAPTTVMPTPQPQASGAQPQDETRQ